MASKFSEAEWRKIEALFDQSNLEYGLPARRSDSVVIGTFNIRKLGAVGKRSSQSWNLLVNIARQFDLLAIQEVMDDLSGLEHLVELLGTDYGMVASDVTGAMPGRRGNAERLAFIFNWKRVQRTALASDVTYDRSEVIRNLYENRFEYAAAWDDHSKKLGKWEEKAKQRRESGGRAPSKPPIELPRFLTFIRQPHCVTFRIPGIGSAAPYEFLVINAHLLYGKNKKEREWEFRALTEWLCLRAKQADTLYHPNLLLLGDCNLDFDGDVNTMRDEIDQFIKGLNEEFLRSRRAAEANFPLLTPHPQLGVLRTALRQKQTYDQIGLFIRDQRLPKSDLNHIAGSTVSGFNYGVFNIANLISNAMHGKDISALSESQRKSIYKKAEFDISDHMPAWIRLPRPS